MNQNTDQQPNLINLDIPLRDGTPGYLGSFFNMYLKYAGLLASPDFNPRDNRPYLLSSFLIAMIPGEKRRTQLIQKLTNKIEMMNKEEIERTKSELNDEQRARIEHRACIEVVGHVSDFLDEHMGLSVENKLGFV